MDESAAFPPDVAADPGRPGPATETGVIALGGALGATARWTLSGLVGDLAFAGGPLAALLLDTLIVNTVGAGLLGALLAALETHTPHPLIRPLLAVGFLGSFTTFSTLVAENQALAVRLGSFGIPGAVLHATVSVALGWGAFVLAHRSLGRSRE